MQSTVAQLTGQLLVVGFTGQSIPPSLNAALAAGERGGIILFRSNIGPSLAEVARLNHDLARLAPADRPLLLGVDQEGGRVQRLGPPTLRVPPLSVLGRVGQAELAFRFGERQGQELAALGFTMNFAPVLDVNTRAENPIIGDRSFGADPQLVARLGVAYAKGLAAGGVHACGKHYPGHGDTTVDSHLALPTVHRSREGLEAMELVPFRAAAEAGIAAFMTAHVHYPTLDDEPATIAPSIATHLLREVLGFGGLLVSDDLEMGALQGKRGLDESAVLAVAAGCDVLLVCAHEEAQRLAHEGLVREAEKSAAFRARCEEALARGLRARRARAPRPVLDPAALDALVGGAASRALEDELARASEARS